jgi:outer membrane protein assembly factor BamB
VAATRFGKVYGIDSSNGKIIWSRILNGQILPIKLHVTRTVSDGGDPEVVLVAQRRADNVRILASELCCLGLRRGHRL